MFIHLFFLLYFFFRMFLRFFLVFILFYFFMRLWDQWCMVPQGPRHSEPFAGGWGPILAVCSDFRFLIPTSMLSDTAFSLLTNTSRAAILNFSTTLCSGRAPFCCILFAPCEIFSCALLCQCKMQRNFPSMAPHGLFPFPTPLLQHGRVLFFLPSFLCSTNSEEMNSYIWRSRLCCVIFFLNHIYFLECCFPLYFGREGTGNLKQGFPSCL